MSSTLTPIVIPNKNIVNFVQLSNLEDFKKMQPKTIKIKAMAVAYGHMVIGKYTICWKMEQMKSDSVY